VRRWLIVLAEVALVGAARGQARIVRPIPVSPASCQSGLDSLRLKKAPGISGLVANFDSLRDSTVISAGPGPGFRLNMEAGVAMITGIMQVAHHPPSTLAPLELDLLVLGSGARPDSERILALQVDSARVTIGLATATPTMRMGPTGFMSEHDYIMIQPDQALAILRAHKLHGHLGSTSFSVSGEDQDRLRGVVLFALCGPK